eukprot:tig00020904_g15247.t1
MTTLNAFLLQLVSRLHARGAEILVFAGDAVVAFIGASGGRTLREATALAVEAARDVQAIAFERGGQRLTAHTGVGAGDLHIYLLRGSQRAAQALYAGELIAQVCEAQRNSKGNDIVLSAEAFALLEHGCAAELLPAASVKIGAGARRRALHRLLPPPEGRPPSRTLAPASTGGTRNACACGAPLRAEAREAEAELAPFAEELFLLAPRAATSTVGDDAKSAFFAHDIRTVFAVFASFPELDDADWCWSQPTETPPDYEAEGVTGGTPGEFEGGRSTGRYRSPRARHAARFGQVVRSVHRVAEDFGGSVNKILIDDKARPRGPARKLIPALPLFQRARRAGAQGASAIIGFGLPGGFAHEDDAERAVRAALALQAWFRESAAPFACGIAAGRTFCGTLGAPCRKEYALIGDSVILAARLMGKAREAVAAGLARVRTGEAEPKVGAPLQEVLCDQSIVAGVAGRGRSTGLSFEALPPAGFKGFAEAVPVFRPGNSAATTSIRRRDGVTSRRSSIASEARGLVPGAAAHLHPVSLLGRDAELERAVGAVEALAARGRGSTLVIEAEAGMGKTRLVRELRRACAARGVLTLSSAASAVEESTPLWALRGLVASVAETSSGEALAADLERRRLLAAPDAALLWETLFGGGGGAGDVVPFVSLRSRSSRGRSRRRPRPDRESNADTAADGEASASEVDGRSSYRPLDASRGRLASVFGVGLVTRVAATLARLISGLEQSRPPPAVAAGSGPQDATAPAPIATSTRVALLLEDVHWMDSVSWFVVRCIRDACPGVLLVLAARPMVDPPRDYLLLSGQLQDPAGPGGLLPASSSTSSMSTAPSPPISRAPRESFFSSGKSGKIRPPGSDMRRALQLAPVDSSLSGPFPSPEARSMARATGTIGRLPPLRANARAVLLRLGPISRTAAHDLLMARRPPSARAPRPRASHAPPTGPLERHVGLLGAVERVLDKAAGVPLFLVELCRQHATAAGAGAGPGGALPTTSSDAALQLQIQQIVLARVDQLPPQAQAVLKLLAVIGSDFSREQALATDPSGLGPAAVRRAFRTLRRAGLIVESGGVDPERASDEGDDAASSSSAQSLASDAEDGDLEGAEGADDEARASTFCFSHGLLRDAVYAGIPSGLRWEVHGRLARWLEAHRPDDSAAIALHWKAAGEPERALLHLERAARAAARANALREARRLFGELVAAVDDLALCGPPPSRPPRPLRPAASEAARWRAVRAGALRHLALAENFSGAFEAAGQAAEACVACLGEPMPRSRIGPAAALGIYLRARGAARRVGKAARPGSHWLHAPESEEQRGALLDASLILGWTGLLKEAFGGRGGLPWVALALLRAYEISEGTPRERIGVADCRVWANFSSLLDGIGFSAQGAALLAQARELAERLNNDTARAAVENHAGMQACRVGDFAEGARRFRAAAGLASPPPNSHELLASAAMSLLLAGDLAESRRCCDEAALFASRFGADSYGAFLAALVGALAAAFAGSDEAAAALRRAEQGVGEYKGVRWWVRELVRAAQCLLAWRAGHVGAALSLAEACTATWRAQRATFGWLGLRARGTSLRRRPGRSRSDRAALASVSGSSRRVQHVGAGEGAGRVRDHEKKW